MSSMSGDVGLSERLLSAGILREGLGDLAGAQRAFRELMRCYEESGRVQASQYLEAAARYHGASARLLQGEYEGHPEGSPYLLDAVLDHWHECSTSLADSRVGTLGDDLAALLSSAEVGAQWVLREKAMSGTLSTLWARPTNELHYQVPSGGVGPDMRETIRRDFLLPNETPRR